MVAERKVSVRVLLLIFSLFFLLRCSPAAEPATTDETRSPSVSGTATPTTGAPATTTSPQSEEAEISPLPSDLIFTLGESNGQYWLDMVTLFDELPCGNFRLVTSQQSPEPGSVVIDVEGISLAGEDCLESVGPAGTRIMLGSLAAETELRFRHEQAVDRYRIETGPGLLIVEALTASFTRSGDDHWNRLPSLYFYNPFNKEREQLPADLLLFYTTTAWNEGDGAALREAAASVFAELPALGAEPLAAEGRAHGLYYPTPPLDVEGGATHIIRYFHYDGPLAPVKELLTAHGELRISVISREGSNLPTATPRNTPLPTSTPPPTRTPLPPTPTHTPTPSPGPVSIFPSKEVYQPGEPVEFTITNHLDRPIYYRYGGCEWPLPLYLSRTIDMRLKVEPLEPEPQVRSLAPGEAVTCTWDAQVYQRPSLPPLDSLSLMEELAPVPRGQYQLRLNYAFTPEEVASQMWRSTGPSMAHSPVFTIFGPYLLVDRSHEKLVTYELQQEAYPAGSPVDFRVRNNFDRPIYYRYGCADPIVLFYSQPDAPPGEQESVRLILRVEEERPAVKELQPGETRSCSWDQQAWQDPGKEGRARFEEYDPALGPLQVPPGRYRFMMVYYFADPGTFVSEGERLREAQRVVTEQFVVTE